MASLVFNQLYRIRSGPLAGVWRAICSNPSLSESVLVRLPIEFSDQGENVNKIDAGRMGIQLEKMSFLQSALLLDSEEMVAIEIDFGQHHEDDLERASEAVRVTYKKRVDAMQIFCNASTLAKHFEKNPDFGGLVCEASGTKTNAQHYAENGNTGKAAISSIYKWLRLLCLYGFNVRSLMPKFSLCGAPGRPREYDRPESKPGVKTIKEKLNTETHPQQSIPLENRAAIIAKMGTLVKRCGSLKRAYARLVLDMYIKKWITVDGKLTPEMPEEGTYPAFDQVSRLYKESVSEVDRLANTVTKLTMARSHRGLSGFAHDGVAGPGHVYAIDSTQCDSHLRSAAYRQWLVGRPFVYWLVDVWSTAITGFYVCLNFPSWQSARIALFCSVYDRDLLSKIFGFPIDLGLDPCPTLPSIFISDRGEYLSEGARATADALSFGQQFNPAYRADLKGLVEVFNRIQKDDAVGLIPGTFDLRRMAYEESHDAKLSMLILREFVEYLVDFARRKNLSASRSHRLTDEMRASGVHPSPAGLWHFGHKIGIGYRSVLPKDLLIKELLSPLPMSVGRSGLHHGSLYYQSDEIDVQSWSAHARNFGGIPIDAFTIPSAPQAVWAQLPGDQLRTFWLAPNSSMSADASLLEHYDTLAFERAQKKSLEHERLQQEFLSIATNLRLAKQARNALKNAERPPVNLGKRDARSLEMGHAAASSSIGPSEMASDQNVVAEIEAYKALQHRQILALMRGD